VYQTGYDFMRMVMPHELSKFKLYQDKVPLFTRYQIESQIESAFRHEVRLPSGGALVIDPTEALISIDVNSARANKGGDIEETAFNTNLEAAEEIARQLRLRDLGGLVVIDFIDMGPSRHQREVENRLRDHLKADRARVQIGRISRFGLLEMSRQRLRPALGEAHQEICPRCAGLGHVRGVESLGLAVLRLLEEEATKDRISQLIVQLPVPVATFMLNEKRDQIAEIEKRQSVKILLIPNPHLDTPHYDIERIKDSGERTEMSHQLMTEPEAEMPIQPRDKAVVEQPAVTGISPAAPAPVVSKPDAKKPSLLKRLLAVLTGKAESDKDSKQDKDSKSSADKRSGERRRSNSNRNRRGNNRRRSEKQSADKNSEVTTQQDSNQTPSTDASDEGGDKPTRSSNSRRSRRGGRRRRNRPEGEQSAERQLQEKGNTVAPEKKEVDGNAVPEAKPEVDGNVVKGDTDKEVDGNQVTEKPARRSRTGTGSRRRRSPAKDNDTTATNDAENKPARRPRKSAAKSSDSADTAKPAAEAKQDKPMTGVEKKLAAMNNEAQAKATKVAPAATNNDAKQDG
jgi:ribonuclease E